VPGEGTIGNGLDSAEQATVAAVERLGVPFELLPCDPAHADTAAFCAAYGYPPERAANTIVVASKKEPRQYAACVVLATTRLDVNHAVRDLLGSAKCSFASAEEMRALTGMTVGGVTAFGLPAGLPIFIDARVLDLDWVILGTGGRNGKIRISPDVFRRLPGAKAVEGLAVPQALRQERSS
jgi:prolyl-tRNA editing enzyme YbaK/EbsC (Cys-tRNA(Pro) deacylase)